MHADQSHSAEAKRSGTQARQTASERVVNVSAGGRDDSNPTPRAVQARPLLPVPGATTPSAQCRHLSESCHCQQGQRTGVAAPFPPRLPPTHCYTHFTGHNFCRTFDTECALHGDSVAPRRMSLWNGPFWAVTCVCTMPPAPAPPPPPPVCVCVWGGGDGDGGGYAYTV